MNSPTLDITRSLPIRPSTCSSYGLIGAFAGTASYASGVSIDVGTDNSGWWLTGGKSLGQISWVTVRIKNGYLNSFSTAYF